MSFPFAAGVKGAFGLRRYAEVGENWVSCGWEDDGAKRKGGGIRGEVNSFSRGSRKRISRLVGCIGKGASLPLLVTLTYPAEFSRSPVEWARHLEAWVKRLRREYGDVCVIWRREFQVRGAPHFHLAIWGAPWLPAGWVARSWYEVVGSGDERHKEAGTRVEYPRTRTRWLLYLVKELGKEVQATARGALAFLGVSMGRSWGVWGRAYYARELRGKVSRHYLVADEFDAFMAQIGMVVSCRGHAWAMLRPPWWTCGEAVVYWEEGVDKALSLAV